MFPDQVQSLEALSELVSRWLHRHRPHASKESN